MGNGGYSGGSSKIFLSSEGTTWDSGEPTSEERGASAVRKRWDQDSTLNSEGRVAAKAYRKSVSRFLADCASAFAADRMTAVFPKPPKELTNEVAIWGGNADWISKHPERTRQFAEFVKHHGWKPDHPSETF
jgi:hypothetical protein